LGPTLQSPPSSAPRQLDRLRAAIARVPPPMRVLIGFLVLFGIAFAATVGPLFTSVGGQVRAEVAGSVPTDGVAGQQMFLDLAIDNTSNSIIHPLCLAVSFDAPVVVQKVVFQGLDTVSFRDGRACGGDLSGQETASVRVVLVPQQAGTLHVDLVAAQGTRAIGPEVHRTVVVAAP
jgi:hypothetical protein